MSPHSVEKKTSDKVSESHGSKEEQLIKAKTFLVLGLVVVMGLVALPANALVESTFDTGTEGWTMFQNGSSTNPDYASSGGNPGGYIYDHDASSGAYFFVAPEKFEGDWTGYIGGIFSWDVNRLTGPGTIFDLRELRIFNGDYHATYRTDFDPPVGQWTSFSVQLVPENFTVEPIGVTFADIMANVTRVHVRGEYTDNPDTVGLDNVRLQVVPLPGSLLLFGTGFLGLGLVGWRRKRG
jgi:hypothetical protein